MSAAFLQALTGTLASLGITYRRSILPPNHAQQGAGTQDRGALERPSARGTGSQ